VDLDAVDPRLHELLGCVGVGADELRDLVLVELVGDPVVGFDERHGRGGHGEVQLRELADHHGARFMDRFTELSDALGEARHLVEGDADRARAGEELVGRLVGQGRIQEEGLASDPAGAAFRLGEMMGDERVVHEARHLGGADGVGGLADAVGDEHGADPERLKEALKPGLRGAGRTHAPSLTA
jgi:hypothetical protein